MAGVTTKQSISGLVINALAIVAIVAAFGAPTYLTTRPVLAGKSPAIVLLIAYFGTTGFVAIWLYANELALLAAMNLYGVRSKPFRFSLAARLFPVTFMRLSKKATLQIAIAAYFVTIYAFALAYRFIEIAWPVSFEKPIGTILNSVYFSIVTIATVGYGDIAPIGGFARVMASIEILIGVAYSVFFFSIIAGFIRDTPPPPN